MPLPLGPVAPVGIPAGPGVHPHYLEAVRPGPGVLALALGSGADAVSVGFAILPPPAVSATVVEVEPSARHSDKGWKIKKADRAADFRRLQDRGWGDPGPVVVEERWQYDADKMTKKKKKRKRKRKKEKERQEGEDRGQRSQTLTCNTHAHTKACVTVKVWRYEWWASLTGGARRVFSAVCCCSSPPSHPLITEGERERRRVPAKEKTLGQSQRHATGTSHSPLSLSPVREEVRVPPPHPKKEGSSSSSLLHIWNRSSHFTGVNVT